jgi:hypothetical protein
MYDTTKESTAVSPWTLAVFTAGNPVQLSVGRNWLSATTFCTLTKNGGQSAAPVCRFMFAGGQAAGNAYSSIVDVLAPPLAFTLFFGIYLMAPKGPRCHCLLRRFGCQCRSQHMHENGRPNQHEHRSRFPCSGKLLGRRQHRWRRCHVCRRQDRNQPPSWHSRTAPKSLSHRNRILVCNFLLGTTHPLGYLRLLHFSIFRRTNPRPRLVQPFRS